jgi:hypothetical protein
MTAAMGASEKEVRSARLLQVRTQWAFSECLRLVRTETPAAIEIRVASSLDPARSAAMNRKLV